MMHQNSIEAYAAEFPKLEGRKLEVLAYLRQHGPCTDRGVMSGLGYSEPNAVRPRITEMVGEGVLREAGGALCPVTKRTVRLVEVSTGSAHP